MVIVDIWQRDRGSAGEGSGGRFLPARPVAAGPPVGTPPIPLPNVDNHHAGVSVWRARREYGRFRASAPGRCRRRQALTPAPMRVGEILRAPVYNQLPNRRERSDPGTGPGDSEEHPPRTGVLRVMSWDLR